MPIIRKSILIIILFSKLCALSQGNERGALILVTDQTVKVNEDQELYYAFNDGDEIVFDLEVVKGKFVREVEILEYPGTIKFSDYKTVKIESKHIKVDRKAIYIFRIKGGGIGERICKLRIYRIPKSPEFADFNSSVEWQTQFDTLYQTKYRKELVKVDTQVVSVIDRVERVHSQTNENGNVSEFLVTLPQNQASELETYQVIAWSYFVGVGNEGHQAFELEKKKYISELGIEVASLFANPLVGIALGTYTAFSNPPEGDNVRFWLAYRLPSSTEVLFHASGNSVIASGRVTGITQGSFNVILQNDNLMNGINVEVKILAIVVSEQYSYQPYQVMQVKQSRFPLIVE